MNHKLEIWQWHFIAVFTFIFLCCLPLYSGSTGKIAGQVIDSENNELLAGANIVIEGTLLGAAVDIDGQYFVLNIPPGSYTITASMVGYLDQKVTNVRVHVDKTTRLDFALSTETLETETIIVEAEKPVIQADIASSLTVLTSEQMASTPVDQFKDLLDKQVGVREADMRGLFIRGEREYATSLRIDDLETRDNIDNQVETRINPDAVEEVNISTGGFNAEYGNAASGLINVIMKEGSEEYQGTLDTRFSIPAKKHFGPTLKEYYDAAFDSAGHWQTVANPQTRQDSAKFSGIYEQFLGKPDLLRELYLWRMRDEMSVYGDKPDMVLSGTFGGPIPIIDNATFFLSGMYEKTHYLFNQAQPFYENLNFSGKFIYHISSASKISVTARYTELSGINRYDRKESVMSLGLDRSNDPDQTRENRFVFESVEGIAWTAADEANHLTHWPYLDRMSITNRFRNQLIVKLTHALSSKTFFDLSVSFNNFRIYGTTPAPRDTNQTVTLRDREGNIALLTGEYADAPNGYWYLPINDPLGMGQANIIGGTHGNYETSWDKSFSLLFNITSQIDRVNQLTAGFNFNYFDNKKFERREGSDDKRYWWDWHVFPKSLAMWIQDKVEFEGMIINAGLRVDGRIPHGSWMDMNNYRYHDYWSSSPLFRPYYLGPDSISAGPHYTPPTRWVFSPRLSIAHPIGSDAKIYFNYTHLNQDQPFEYQYKIQRRTDMRNQDIFGDPELPFIKTIQYEIGYEQNISNLFFSAISGYYRDVSNKLELVNYQSMARLNENNQAYGVAYFTYAPDLYTSVLGLEFRFEKRVGRFWRGWFNYNYELFTSGIKGYSLFREDPSRDPRARNSSITANQNRTPIPMPKFNLGITFSTPPKFGLALGSVYPFADMQLNLLFWWKSQPTITYNPGDLVPPYDPIDNVRWKPHNGTNLSFSKRIDLNLMVKPVFYIYISNLFNTKNMFRGAFTRSQTTDYLRLLEEQGGEPGERQDLALQVLQNIPSDSGPGSTPYDLYLNPRQIFIGLRLEFN